MVYCRGKNLIRIYSYYLEVVKREITIIVAKSVWSRIGGLALYVLCHRFAAKSQSVAVVAVSGERNGPSKVVGRGWEG